MEKTNSNEKVKSDENQNCWGASIVCRSAVCCPEAGQERLLWGTCFCPNYSPEGDGREGGGDDVVGHAEDRVFDIHAGL